MNKETLHPETSRLVSASAGTGKTWLLVSRILRLLLEGEKPDSILAITFTNKAAGEMQERLMQRLLDLSFEQSDQLRQLQELGIDPDAKYQQQVNYLYESTLHADYPVRVTTFHSFCQHIISMFPTSKIPLNFQILANNREYTNRACDKLFEKASQDPDGKIAQNLMCLFTECNGIENARTALKSFLDRRNDWLAYRASGNPEKKLLDILGLEKADEPVLKVFWQDAMREKLTRYADLRERSANSRDNVSQKTSTIKKILGEQTLVPEAFELLFAQIHNTSGVREFKLPKGKHKSLTDGEVNELEQLSLEISNAMQAANEELRKQANYRLNKAWYQLGDTLVEIYQNLKYENSLADFNDLEWTAKEILSKDESSGRQLQQRLSNRIKHVLIDEFQDTNPIQWELIRPLLNEIASQQEGSIFIVGDTKQSIYGFRGADPSLQNIAGNWLMDNMQGSRSTIEKSYRSAQKIIDFVNHVFTDPTDNTRLNSFRKHETFQKTKGGVHIFDLIETDADDPEHGKKSRVAKSTKEQQQKWRNPLRAPLETDKNLTEYEAELVAQAIFAMKESDFAIDEDGSDRPFEYRDALILARRKTKFSFFKTALRKYGIPYAGADDIDPSKSFEVHDICSLLRFLHDPQRNDLLARILRSPLFSFSSEDLLKLAKGTTKSWFYELSNGKEEWQQIYRLLNDLIRLYGRLPPHDLLDHIYDQTDIIPRYLAASDPSRHQLIHDNFNALLDQALDYRSGRYPDTLDFVDYIQLQQSSEGKGAADTSEKCVRMMSIHAAKGLEAPVVFLVDTQSPKNVRDTYKAQFNWSSDDGEDRAFVLFSPDKKRSVGIKNIDSQIRQREQREEANLLYVALTRARQYLLISDSHSTISEGSWYQISKAAHGKLKDNPMFVPSINVPDHDIKRESDQTKIFSPILATSPPLIFKESRPSSVDKKVSFTSRPSDNVTGKAYGTIFHRALELLCAEQADDEQQIKQQICEEHPECKEQIDEWFSEASELYRLEQFKELFDNARYTHIYNELRILYSNHDGEQISGMIDRLCVDAKCAWVIDYKTHRIERDKVDILAKTFEPQMQLYQSGVEKLFPDRQYRASVLFTSPRILYDYRF